MPKILVLSDLHWSSDSREIEESDIASFRDGQVFPKEKKFNRLKDYAEIILTSKPELILFAGDVTGDGSCGRGFHKAFLYLLTAIEMMGIHTLYVQGDHDEQRYINYLESQTNDFNYVHHISGRAIDICGLKILGLSFFHTNQKEDLKSLVKTTKGAFDILLCHCPLKRRNWLFELNCNYIVTGHFDHKCSFIRKKFFLSFGNDFSFISYALLETANEELPIKYGLQSFDRSFDITFQIRKSKTAYHYEVLNIFHEGNLLDLKKMEGRQMLRQLQRQHQFGLKFIQGNDFKQAVEELAVLKKQLQSGEQQWRKGMMTKLNKYRVSDRVKVSYSFVVDYLEELVY